MLSIFLKKYVNSLKHKKHQKFFLHLLFFIYTNEFFVYCRSKKKKKKRHFFKCFVLLMLKILLCKTFFLKNSAIKLLMYRTFSIMWHGFLGQKLLILYIYSLIILSLFLKKCVNSHKHEKYQEIVFTFTIF